MQVWTAGQVIGLIHDVPTCDVLLKRIEREAIETFRAKQSLIIDEDEVPVSATGTVGKNVNNPQAEVYNIGKSKL